MLTDTEYRSCESCRDRDTCPIRKEYGDSADECGGLFEPVLRR